MSDAAAAATGRSAAAIVEPAAGACDLAELVALLPEPASLEPGAWLALSPGAVPQPGLLGRMLGRPAPAGVPLRLRCTALLVRGYAEVSADEQGVAWGRAPLRGGLAVTPADATSCAPDARDRR